MDIDAKKNEVIIGPREALAVKTIFLKDLNLLNKVEEYNDNLFIKVRSTGKLIKATVKMENLKAQVKLDEFETGKSRPFCHKKQTKQIFKI